ncbi:hypothetical protein LZ009_17310 [Ramlibacter sp. XY19]|uniref:hypothetical protein n=1 Tax=Ramlibacter paludis TaxID=2908000 RepID=UPI0023DC8D9B|nr:hypothetical protein [Ramlibacter paludis]MCG2594538.1 hypothetical protein [Ramlibacter paludis]
MRVLSPRYLLVAVLAFGASSAGAETFKCLQTDGRLSFQQLPCADGPPEPPAPAAPAPVHSNVAKPATPDPLSPIPTRRMREVLDMTALLERCRADEPGFADRAAPLYQAWKVRHGVTLTAHKALLAAKVREYRRGAGGMPPQACSEEWLRGLEPMARMPDPRYASVEKTWARFVEALRAADRAAALDCLHGNAELRWRKRIATVSDEDLRRIGLAIRDFKVQWGDDYLKEALAAGDDNRVTAVAFRSVNEEWKISDL